MRIVFAGTPAFGAATLGAILQVHQVSAVLTMPDRPAGRKMREKPSPVKEMALSHGIPVIQPEALKDPDLLKDLGSYNPDIIVVSAYGGFFPSSLLRLAPFGCINIHASLLPRYRGASPITRAIANGDRIAGVSVINMTSKLDAGPVLLSLSTPVLSRMNVSQLHDVLANLGGKAACLALQRIGMGAIYISRQCEREVTYAPKLEKRYIIDWSKSAIELDRFVRAFGPFPGVYSIYDSKLIKIISLEPVTDISRSVHGLPGSVLSISKNGIVVGCGDSCVRLLALQRPGGKRLPAFDFSLGAGLTVGSVLGRGPIV